MRVDIYRRPEQAGHFSYLAVPEAKVIPAEAINTDWELEARAVEVGDGADQLPDFKIFNLDSQMAEKGYAMTALNA